MSGSPLTANGVITGAGAAAVFDFRRNSIPDFERTTL